MKTLDVLVLKCGGRTLDSAERRDKLAEYIKELVHKGYKVICVVSAMGRNPDPYATDTLKNLVYNNLENQLIDRLLACGEIISTLVLDSHFRTFSINSRALNIYETGVLTTDEFGDANIIDINQEMIYNHFNLHDCLVVPGFLGKDHLGNITTLGRGGSDTTAVALAHTFNANDTIIISDVSGVMSADPKMVSEAILYEYIPLDLLSLLTEKGMKMLHNKAAMIAYEKKVNISFSSINDLNNYGTKTEGTVNGLMFFIVTENGYDKVYKGLNEEYIKSNNGNYVKVSLITHKEVNDVMEFYIKKEETIDFVNKLHQIYIEKVKGM